MSRTSRMTAKNRLRTLPATCDEQEQHQSRCRPAGYIQLLNSPTLVPQAARTARNKRIATTRAETSPGAFLYGMSLIRTSRFLSIVLPPHLSVNGKPWGVHRNRQPSQSRV